MRRRKRGSIVGIALNDDEMGMSPYGANPSVFVCIPPQLLLRTHAIDKAGSPRGMLVNIVPHLLLPQYVESVTIVGEIGKDRRSGVQRSQAVNAVVSLFAAPVSRHPELIGWMFAMHLG